MPEFPYYAVMDRLPRQRHPLTVLTVAHPHRRRRTPTTILSVTPKPALCIARHRCPNVCVRHAAIHSLLLLPLLSPLLLRRYGCLGERSHNEVRGGAAHIAPLMTTPACVRAPKGTIWDLHKQWSTAATITVVLSPSLPPLPPSPPPHRRSLSPTTHTFLAKTSTATTVLVASFSSAGSLALVVLARTQCKCRCLLTRLLIQSSHSSSLPPKYMWLDESPRIEYTHNVCACCASQVHARGRRDCTLSH